MWGLVFPGQGSQHVGMGKFLYDNFVVAKDVFTEASEAINLDLAKLCFEGPESALQLTANTQPALLTVSIATFRVLKNLVHLQTKLCAGHSVGEYAALVAAKAISFSDGVRAVRLRGQLMQEAVPVGEGGMLAVIGLDEEQIQVLCQYVTQNSGLGPLEPANFNAPGQIVISGSARAIEWTRTNFKSEVLPGEPKKVRFIPLPVSAPFHCSMMKPAEKLMGEHLHTILFGKPEIPVVQNYNAQAIHDGEQLRENLIRQITGSVKWTQSMQYFLSKNVTHCIEVGSGKVLSGLIKKIDSERFHPFNINTLDDFTAIELALKG